MFSFFVVVVDGPAGRLLGQESFTERQRTALAHIIANAGSDPVAPSEAAEGAPLWSRQPGYVAPALAERVAGVGATVDAHAALNQRTAARHQGYTGDACTQCHGFRVKQTGKCTTCEDCHATSGCS